MRYGCVRGTGCRRSQIQCQVHRKVGRERQQAVGGYLCPRAWQARASLGRGWGAGRPRDKDYSSPQRAGDMAGGDQGRIRGATSGLVHSETASDT